MRHFISLGAGVQSSTMLLMAIHGEIEPKPEAAIFADTGWEPKAVYEWLGWMNEFAENSGIKVYTESRGSIRDDVSAAASGKRKRVANPPFFTLAADGTAGMLRRNCTREYKIELIERGLKRIIGIEPRKRVPRDVHIEQWMGISVDEIGRAKQSQKTWITNRFPLLEKRMTRNDCLLWLEKQGYPAPPKSACIGCPYHSDAYWRELKRTSPDEFADAVTFDKTIRHGLPGATSEVYLHSSLKPLDEVDFRSDEDKGQFNIFGEFGAECEGMCGV